MIRNTDFWPTSLGPRPVVAPDPTKQQEEDEVKRICLDLVADLVDCDTLSDFQEVRSDCFGKLWAIGFTDRFYDRNVMLQALIETGLLLDRGLRLHDCP